MPDVYEFGDARDVVVRISLSRGGLEFLLGCAMDSCPTDGFTQELQDALNEVDRRQGLRDAIENDQNKEDDLRDEAKRDAMLDVIQQERETSVADLDMRDRFLS